ncbi:MAG: HAD family phosphatase [Porphyromonadaceae bacterium]|nr:HAD family phosphatase [Porphyromonadaceae bacterium]
MIKTIVFDLGGVLIHLNRDEALRRFSALGIPDIEKMLDPYLQSGYFLQVEDGRMNKEEFRSALSQLAGRELKQEEIYDAYMGFLEEVASYKFDFIDTLRQDYTVHILSNTNPYVMEFAESNDFLPNGRPLSSYCARKFASCEMGMVKPHRGIFELMIEETGMLPSETLFIDDGPANVQMAEELGFVTYCPANGEDWREAIKAILEQHNR